MKEDHETDPSAVGRTCACKTMNKSANRETKLIDLAATFVAGGCTESTVIRRGEK